MPGYLTIDQVLKIGHVSSIIVAEIKAKFDGGQYLIEDETGTVNLKNLNESEPLKVGDIVSVNSFQLDLVKDVLHMTSFDVRKSGLPTQDQIKAILLLKIKTEIPKSEAHARKIINEYIHNDLRRFARFFWLEYGGYGKDIEENAWNLRGDEFWDGLLNNPEIVFPFVDKLRNNIIHGLDEDEDDDELDEESLARMDMAMGDNESYHLSDVSPLTYERCPGCDGNGCEHCEGTGDYTVWEANEGYANYA